MNWDKGSEVLKIMFISYFMEIANNCTCLFVQWSFIVEIQIVDTLAAKYMIQDLKALFAIVLKTAMEIVLQRAFRSDAVVIYLPLWNKEPGLSKTCIIYEHATVKQQTNRTLKYSDVLFWNKKRRNLILNKRKLQ